jgi:diguanylate cyclase (GGDEF)-like protein/PAS domain S-box-containing protein
MILGHDILASQSGAQAGGEESLPIDTRLAGIQGVFHAAPVGLCTVDLNFRYIIVNECFARMYGKVPADFVGRTVWEVLPKAALQIFAHYEDAYDAENAVERELTLVNPTEDPCTPNAEVIYLRTAQPVRDASGKVFGIAVALLDITARRRMENALRESEENLRYTIELSPHIPWTADAEGRMNFMSPRWNLVTGVPPGQEHHDNWTAGTHPEDKAKVLELWSQAVTKGESFDCDYRVHCAGDEWRWHRGRASPRRNAQNEIVQWYGTVEDIHDRKVAEAALTAKTERLQEVSEELAWLARQDHLTGLANRRTFDEIFGKEMERARAFLQPLVLILADIDHFKCYNDTYGHPAGDEVLRGVAGAIKQAIRRPGDYAIRFGGEEFALILPNTGAKGAALIAERIRSEVEGLRFAPAGAEASGVTMSVGAAVFDPARGDDAARSDGNLIGEADKALYEAKHGGRNRVVVGTNATRAFSP